MLRRRVHRLLSFYLQIDSDYSSSAFSLFISLFYATYVYIAHFLKAVPIPIPPCSRPCHVLTPNALSLATLQHFPFSLLVKCLIFLLLKPFTHLQLKQRVKIIAALTLNPAHLHGADRQSFTGTFLIYLLSCYCFCTASLTFSSSTFCAHSAFMCFVWIS